MLQFIMQELSLSVIQSAHQQQGSGGVIPNQDDERMVRVEQLGLLYIFLQVCFLFSSLGTQLQGSPVQDAAEVKLPFALVRHPREVGCLLVPGVGQAQSRQLFLELERKKKKNEYYHSVSSMDQGEQAPCCRFNVKVQTEIKKYYFYKTFFQIAQLCVN